MGEVGGRARLREFTPGRPRPRNRGSTRGTLGSWGTPSLRARVSSLTRGCKGSQVASESQFHVSRGTSTSPRKTLRPRLSRCHTDRLSTRPRSSACGTEYWGQEAAFSGTPLVAPAGGFPGASPNTLLVGWNPGEPRGAFLGHLGQRHAQHHQPEKREHLTGGGWERRSDTGRPCHRGSPRRRSRTWRISLKTGFRFRFFTAVLRLLSLSGRR